jgi:hypothetical protein
MNTNGSELAKATAAAMRIRIKQRRCLAGVMQYLHNPNAAAESDDVFTAASASTVCKIVFDLLQRLTDSASETSENGTVTLAVHSFTQNRLRIYLYKY